jgi:uncharacterized membrane protein YhfC
MPDRTHIVFACMALAILSAGRALAGYSGVEESLLYLYVLNGLLMIALPVVLAIFIRQRWGARWALFGMGAVTFVGSQIFHIPFNALVESSGILPEPAPGTLGLVIVALFYGLSAGVFEEVARYLTYRFWARDARTWSQGLMLGAGHGGVEAIVLGFLVLVNVLFLVVFQAGVFEALVPEEQAAQLSAQLAAMLDVPWYTTLIGTLERAFALAVHLALSLLVLQAFIRGSLGWLFAAIAWHALLDFVAVFAAAQWNIYVAEAGLAVLALASLALILALKPRTSPPMPAAEP